MRIIAAAVGLTLGVGASWAAEPRDKKAPEAVGCAAVVDDFFRSEVWGKVGAQSCLTCHKPGGDAEESRFILVDPRRAASQDEAMRHNRAAFAKMAATKEKDKSRLLLK